MQSDQPPYRIDLNGPWDLAPCGRRKDVVPRNWSHNVPVPGLVDLAGDYPYREKKYHFHRRVFMLSEREDDVEFDLVLEQTMWTTAVWCNGALVGESDDCYLPQRFRITRHLRPGKNELIVRIGNFDTLPKDHVGGKDYERIEWIPGIWGDAWLHGFRSQCIEVVSIHPNAELNGCRVGVQFGEASEAAFPRPVRVEISEWKSGKRVAKGIGHCDEGRMELELSWNRAQTWSPESPFLYVATVELLEEAGGRVLDRSETRFGLRAIEIRGNQFYLNGKRKTLRGGNIAFHRLLGDVGRRDLPWNLEWARKILAKIPKAHHLEFFRSHIGSMYHRWYDLADEEGILIQDEWPFWGVSASIPLVRAAFEKWLQARGNHPSIILWDPGNECDLSEIARDIIPDLKRLDPTRPWCHLDTHEEHPYHWSLTPVWPERAMGHSRSPEEIRDSEIPAIINEFVWFWLDSKGDATSLTKKVIARWLGERTTKKERLEYQAWLARECIEVWRRLDVAAIQPFVYLSADGGCTANWFDGDLARAKPKPVLRAVKEALAPMGVSIELWDRHFFPRERRTVCVHLFNDRETTQWSCVQIGFADTRRAWCGEPLVKRVRLSAGEHRVVHFTFEMPEKGDFRLLARCLDSQGVEFGVSEKPIRVLEDPSPGPGLQQMGIGMFDPRRETTQYLSDVGLTIHDASDCDLSRCRVLWLGERALHVPAFQDVKTRLREFVRRGGVLIIQEPEFGLTSPRTVEVFPGCRFVAGPRGDVDAGGYDAVLHPTAQCPRGILRGLRARNLSYFNGGVPGIVVSEGTAEFQGRCEVWMRCGLDLKVAAMAAKRIGDGVVILNRVQLRGRLLGDPEGAWPRRADPVARRMLLNMVHLAGTMSR